MWSGILDTLWCGHTARLYTTTFFSYVFLKYRTSWFTASSNLLMMPVFLRKGSSFKSLRAVLHGYLYQLNVVVLDYYLCWNHNIKLVLLWFLSQDSLTCSMSLTSMGDILLFSPCFKFYGILKYTSFPFLILYIVQQGQDTKGRKSVVHQRNHILNRCLWPKMGYCRQILLWKTQILTSYTCVKNWMTRIQIT